MTAVWRNGDYTVPTQKRKQSEAHDEAVRIWEVCAGTGWLGCERLGPPEGWTWRVREWSGDRRELHDERLDQFTCFCTNNLLPVPSFARAHQLYVLYTWICSFVCKMNSRLGHASCSAWCMEGRLELWAVVLHGRLDDFIGLTHRGGSEHRSQRGMCVNSVHGTFAACAVQNSEVIVHHSRGGRMSVRCVHPVTAIVG